MIPYKFHFIDELTNAKVAEDIRGTACYGATVSQEALNLRNAGYKPTSGTPDTKALTVTSDSANEFTFYYIGYFNVVHVRDKGTDVSAAEEIDFTPSIRDNRYSLTARVTDGYLYGGTFSDKDCQTVFGFAEGENGVLFTPKAGATYYIWEVKNSYLGTNLMSGYASTGNGNNSTVAEICLLTAFDRPIYLEAGFTITNQNYASEKNEEKVAYSTFLIHHTRTDTYDLYYVLNGSLRVKTGYTAGASITMDEGYIGAYKLSDVQFEDFKTNGITFTTYLITLDGVKVSGVKQRTLTYKGEGEGKNYQIPAVSDTAITSSCVAADVSSTSAMQVVDDRAS